jgi:hypothetical protein
MIKLSKTSLPENTEIKSENDYRGGVVFDLLWKDCCGKCYICEHKTSSPNVEHVIPHNNDPQLKYDWNNLLLACFHCNNIKNNLKYGGIINCIETDPEKYIRFIFRIDGEHKEEILIEKIADFEGVSQTVDLIDKVYNGTTPPLTGKGCENLRTSVTKEINNFNILLENYEKVPEEPLKNIFRKRIIESISRFSSFAAFKREIIRSSKYNAEFAVDLA